jgi:hypothetical protein
MDAILRRIVGMLEFVEQIYDTVHSHGGWRTRRSPRCLLMHAWMNGSVSMDARIAARSRSSEKYQRMNEDGTPAKVSLFLSCRIFRTRLPTTPYHQPSAARSQRNTCPQVRVASRLNGWSGCRAREGMGSRYHRFILISYYVVSGCKNTRQMNYGTDIRPAGMGDYRIGTKRLLIYKLIVLVMELAATLKAFIEEGQDWERKHTSVKGVSIIRLPATKNRTPSLAIDFNPIGDNGLPMKKKGIMIMNGAELAAFRAAFNNEKVDSLIAALEEVLPERKSSGKQAKPDVLQI